MNHARLSDVAGRLLSIVQVRPGIHFRELERAAGLTSPGQLRHHLDHLQKRALVVEIRDGGFHRFFAAGEHDRELRQRMARLSRPVPRRIATALLQQRLSRTALRRALGCADSTLGYYLSRMEQSGELVKHTERARAFYALADPESVRRVLAAQQARRAPVMAQRELLDGYGESQAGFRVGAAVEAAHRAIAGMAPYSSGSVPCSVEAQA